MLLRSILRGVMLASGTMVLVAGAWALSSGKGRRRTVGSCAPGSGEASTKPETANGREYFRITRTRSKESSPPWLLQGFGRYQCFLFFDTWQQAMDQATFRMESLGVESGELIKLTF